MSGDFSFSLLRSCVCVCVEWGKKIILVANWDEQQFIIEILFIDRTEEASYIKYVTFTQLTATVDLLIFVHLIKTKTTNIYYPIQKIFALNVRQNFRRKKNRSRKMHKKNRMQILNGLYILICILFVGEISLQCYEIVIIAILFILFRKLSVKWGWLQNLSFDMRFQNKENHNNNLVIARTEIKSAACCFIEHYSCRSKSKAIAASNWHGLETKSK